MELVDTLGLMATLKSEQILVRVTTKEKKILQRAADLTRRRLADYVRFIALEGAERDLAEAANEEKK